MKVSELEEANAALEDMNTRMEATALQAQSQRDEMQAQIASLKSDQERAAHLEKQKQDLKLQLQVRPCNIVKISLLVQLDCRQTSGQAFPSSDSSKKSLLYVPTLYIVPLKLQGISFTCKR